jgi:hypothetical protein
LGARGDYSTKAVQWEIRRAQKYQRFKMDIGPLPISVNIPSMKL